MNKQLLHQMPGREEMWRAVPSSAAVASRSGVGCAEPSNMMDACRTM